MNRHSLKRIVFASFLTVTATTSVIWGQAKTAPPIDGVIGKLQSFDGKSLDVQTPSGLVHVVVKQPLTTYKQVPSDLSHVDPRLTSVWRRPNRLMESKWRSKSLYFPQNCVEPRRGACSPTRPVQLRTAE